MIARRGQLVLLGAVLWLAGCSAPGAPGSSGMGAASGEVLEILPGRYAEAFAAAVDAGRRAGMPPVVRDPRLGRIETAPAPAASLLEPWAGPDLESTVAFQRRRATFEFAPLNAPPVEPAAAAPDLLGVSEPPADLTRHAGSLGMRVQVYIERASAPGLRRSTWSRRLTTRAEIARGEAEPLPAAFWTPIARDLAYETRLRQAVAEALRRPPPP